MVTVLITFSILMLFCSLNSEKRRAELLQVTHENLTIYNRITAQESEYRRELWEEDWAKTEQRRDGITRYPRGVADKQVNSIKETLRFTAINMNRKTRFSILFEISKKLAFITHLFTMRRTSEVPNLHFHSLLYWTYSLTAVIRTMTRDHIHKVNFVFLDAR